MYTITINVDDVDEAIDVYAACLHRYGFDTVRIDGSENTPVEAVTAMPELVFGDHVDSDPTPPHGTPRPTTTPTALGNDAMQIRAMIRNAVACPRCTVRAGTACRSQHSQYYPDFIHQARIDAWNRLP